MITVIAPHARPEFSANLLASFQRQRGVECRLLVVENGAASGSFPEAEGVTILQSTHHQADAMNSGLWWMRDSGCNAWARFDDDDYYGPDYLAAVERSFDQQQTLDGGGVVVSGMPWRFVMLDDGLHQFTATGGPFTGGTLAASSTDVAEFPRCADDDVQWWRLMHERQRDRGGAILFQERKSLGYCYDRRTRSAPRVIPGGDIITRRAFGESLFYGRQALSAVDSQALAPLSRVDAPSDEEVFAAMGAL